MVLPFQADFLQAPFHYLDNNQKHCVPRITS